MATPRRTTRFALLVAAAIGLALAGCAGRGAAPASAPTHSQPAPGQGSAASASQGQDPWQQLVAAARREGSVVVGVPPGDQYRLALMEPFKRDFPDIEIEIVPLHTRDFVPRFLQERAAGKHLWDVYIGGPDIDLYRVAAEGGFVPVQPEIILPEVLDDRSWRGGLAQGFSDDAKAFIYNYGASSGSSFSVNREFVPEAELRSTDDLWNPALRGKFVWDDPTRSGSGTNAAAVIIYRYGDDALRRLWGTQEVTVSADPRQIGEWIVRGRSPVAIGLNSATLRQFQAQGLGQQVTQFPVPNFATFGPGFNSIQLPADPPHPNARKMFLNWFLSKDAQTAYSQGIKENSRRLDVPIADPSRAMPEGGELLNTQSEAFAQYRMRANDLARELLTR
jgi:iron(III) transport system substrate-binding protein